MWRSYFQLPRTVHVLCIGTLINRAGALIIPFLTLYLTTHLGFDSRFATLCMAAYGLGGIGGVLIGGHLADTIGRRSVMAIALFGGAASILVFMLVRTGWAVFACVFVFALLMEMFRPAASAMIADLVDAERRPAAYGLQYIAVNLGFAAAASAGGLIAGYWGYHWLFWIDAGTAAVFGLIVLCALPETLPKRAVEVAAAVPIAVSPVALQAPRMNGAALAAFGRVFRDGTFMLFVLAALLIAAAYMQAMSTFPLYLRAFDINEFGYGRIIAINGILIVVLQVPVLGLTMRNDRAWVLCAAAVVTALGFALTAAAGTELAFAGTVVVWTLGEIMAAPYIPAVVSDLAPAELRGRYMGVLSMAFSLGGVIGIPLGGQVLDRFGGQALWLGTCVFALLAAGVYVAIRRQIAPAGADAGTRVLTGGA
jgi:predicted MFS family arabinose efflux permease